MVRQLSGFDGYAVLGPNLVDIDALIRPLLAGPALDAFDSAAA
jgi:hypothetical protein